MISPSPFIVSVAQNSAGPEVNRNLAALERLLADCPRSDLVALPEMFAVRGTNDDCRAAAETIEQLLPDKGAVNDTGPIAAWLSDLAKRLGAWVLAGSVVEKSEQRFFNTSLLFNREGALAAKYRKIHLFEAVLDSGQTVREREIYEAGVDPLRMNIEGWLCGFAICYDLRFPELFRHYAGQGVDILAVPSNFTRNTGKDHWETLLRARAIENQAFVIAPNQCGNNSCTGVISYGHSIIAGPWGEILGMAGDKESVISARLDPVELAGIRERMPALNHRRL